MSMRRFGVSLDEEVLNHLDNMVERENLPNRSRAISYLVNKNLVEQKWNSDEIVVGAVIVVYDHSMQELHKAVNALQHDYNCLILSGQHIHLDAHNCLEVITVKGTAKKLIKLFRKYKGIKGLKSVELVMSGTDN
ncbi:MAG TPA: nickel-responsive transcriptional regulator NikR [Bacteroidales bacterium]|nr:nickel-responsive transcriptional regulator NikR [Bacteroidales bacterium]